MDLSIVVLAAAGGGLFSGALGTLIVQWFRRSKTGAETARLNAEARRIDTDATVALVHEYRLAIAEVRADLKADNDALKVRLLAAETAEHRCALEVSQLRLEVSELRRQLTNGTVSNIPPMPLSTETHSVTVVKELPK